MHNSTKVHFSKSFTYIRGKRWYYRLIPNGYDSGTNICLMDEYSLGALEDKLIIGFELLKENDKHSRLFAVFDSYIELFLYQVKIPIRHRNFYELVLGKLPQKPHFDVDIKRKEIPQGKDIDKIADSVKEDLIASIFAIIREKDINLDISKDVLLYQSHGPDKRSFHVVIHHYCHADNIQALAFYTHVTKKMNPELAKYVDHSVYSSKQNFRLFGSQKLGSGRPKLFYETFQFQKKEITHVYDMDFGSETSERADKLRRVETLKESLVSWVKDCEYLPSFQTEEERTKKRNYIDSGDLPEESVREAESLLQRKDFPFVVRDIKGSIISLRRLRPSFCDICERMHEHENPYLLVVEGSVYFCCRRSSSKKMLLGEIDIVADISKEVFEMDGGDDVECHFELGGYDHPKSKPKEKYEDALGMIASIMHPPRTDPGIGDPGLGKELKKGILTDFRFNPRK